jgi:hypothetical protein
MGRLSHTTD